MGFQMNPGKSSLEGDTLTEYLRAAVKLSTGKDEQVDAGLFYLLKLSSKKKKISFQLMRKE